MSTYWTFECAGVENTAEAWGITNLQGQFLSLATDTVSFDVAVSACDGAAPFAFGAWVSIRYGRAAVGTGFTGGTRWFYGQVQTIPRRGSAGGESLSYTLAGVWSCLEQRVFEQPWYVWNSGTGALELSQTSHLFLNVKEDLTAGGALVMSTTSEQIGAVMDWAIGTACVPAHSAADQDPIAKGTIPTGINVPIDEVRDLTCAEVIRRQLRWQPDAVSWVDYSTATPTINFARRNAVAPDTTIPAVTFPIGSRPLSSIDITRRDDLVVPAVVLKFERVDEDNAGSHLAITTQSYPTDATGNAPRTFKATLDLKGYRTSYVSASVTCATIDTTSEAWWLAHFPWATSTDENRTKSVTLISAGARPAGSAAYPRELTRGQIADWMDVIGRQENLQAVFQETTEDDVTKERSIKKRTVNIKIVATDAVTQTYSTLETYESGDPVPAGLAQALYDALSEPQFSGSITLTEEEIATAMAAQGLGNRPGVGTVINLTGGLTEWATMRALVTQATVDVPSGTTTFVFGPAPHLGLPDLIELLRVTRGRQVWNNPRARGGSLAGGSSVGLGRDTGATSGDGGASSSSYQKLASAPANYIEADPAVETATAATHKMAFGANTAVRTATASAVRSLLTAGAAIVDLNTADCGGKEIKIREIDYCDGGVLKKIRVACSEPYAAP